MEIKHEGISIHRLNREPKEAAFAAAWKDRAPGSLGYLLCGQDRRLHDYSQRDATIAATIIQWLGSPVGQNFIDEVRESKLYQKESV